MMALILIGISLLLLAAFYGLTAYESSHGVRFFAAKRQAFDASVSKAAFTLTHIDFGTAFKVESRRLAERGLHAAAHLSLRAIRFVERLLTRVVKHLRAKTQSTHAPTEPTRPFVQTLNGFKQELKANRGEIKEMGE